MYGKKTFKKGKYYIGDPSYALDYDEYWKYTGREGDELPDWYCADGTAYGDGSYFDKEGNEYFVDTGIICICAHRKVTKQLPTEHLKLGKGYNIVSFKQDFEVTMDKGAFVFGHIEIDTANDEDDED